MAQAIYRERFVHFRYPGHENDELVGSSSTRPDPVGLECGDHGRPTEVRFAGYREW